jgi:3-oxoacyl-[acyl-carrier-protein] synthase III
VACGELGSLYVNWRPESKEDLRLSSMGYTLGDGGGAAVLSRVQEGEERGIKARWFLSDSSYWRVAVIPLMNHSKRLFRSNGAEIERAALEYVPIGVEETMKLLEWDFEDIDMIIPHQVSSQIIENLFYKKHTATSAKEKSNQYLKNVNREAAF